MSRTSMRHVNKPILLWVPSEIRTSHDLVVNGSVEKLPGSMIYFKYNNYTIYIDYATGFGSTRSELPLQAPKNGSSTPFSSTQTQSFKNHSIVLMAIFTTSRAISPKDVILLASCHASPSLKSTITCLITFLNIRSSRVSSRWWSIWQLSSTISIHST
jgi:hypothetical protein